MGCDGFCKAACPYDALQFGPEPDAKAQKCDLCLERWTRKKKPVCVEACPMRALDAGPLNELKVTHGDIQEAEGFTHFEKVKPSIIFKSRRQGIPSS
jgi:anaerobic dimethyl sulfoxide reductase subunit B (iron-sulfur subunit)